VKFWIDQNMSRVIVAALQKAYPDHEFVYVRETQYNDAADEILLEEAARLGIVIITHDKRTLVPFAYERIRSGLPMPGVIAVKQLAATGATVRHLIFLIGTSEPADFDNLVWHLPLPFEP
jgi:predicted nuclease of predicted toxin-antitoxin system